MNHLVLGDSLEALLDHRGKTPKKLGGDFEPTGVPVASALLVRDGRLDLSEARYVSGEMHAKWMPQRTKRGDVILTSEAPAGRVARVVNDDPLVLGQRLFCLRGKAGVLDSGFLYYALQSHPVQSSILGHSTGTTVVGIRQSALRLVRIPAPSFPEQQAIADVLGALDDKIAANTALAQTQRDLARTTWDAFRRGADTVTLGDLVTPGLSGVWGEEVEGPNAGVEVYALRGRDLEDLLTGQLLNPPRRWISSTQATRRIDPDAQEIWTAGSGTLGPSLLITPDLRAAMALPLTYSNFVKRLVARDGASGHLPSAWFALWQDWERGNFDNYRTGTAMPNLDVGALLSGVEVPMLPATAQHHVHFWANVVLRRELEAENRVLAATRDALLPQLMSGKLRVRDAEAAASEAGV